MAASGNLRRLSTILSGNGGDQTMYTVPANTNIANAVVFAHNVDTANAENVVLKVTPNGGAATQVKKRTILPEDDDALELGILEPGDVVAFNATADVRAHLCGIVDD